MNKKIIHILIIILFPALLNGQEIMTGLYSNASVNNASKKVMKNKSIAQIRLPFIDDFSSARVFPNDTLWVNDYAFVNASYPYFPPTVGVATLDALNDTGALYEYADAYGFIADSLTSGSIQLDSIFGNNPRSLKISDSLYFSFYYQPQGIGNSPEPEDSLVLEFYSPVNGAWNHMWSSAGSTLAEFRTKYNVWFKQVMVPITDSVAYFHKDFRFRFYNYASLANNSMPSWAGNVDQWNLDYVYLNTGRNMADSVYKDIAFVEPASSTLKNYYSMPWSQFCEDPEGEMKDSLFNTISNLDTIVYNSSYKYDIYDESGSSICQNNGGTWNIQPFILNGYQDYFPHAHPPLNCTYPCNTEDSAVFKIVHVVKETTTNDTCKQNDTTAFSQEFYNFYAYDDGSPEAGYGLTPANSMLAYRFTLNHPDTLRAVKMFFNQTYLNSSQQYFSLTIWNDIAGYPGDILYQKSGLKPQYENNLNEYSSYDIDDALLLLSGTFYAGWKQATDDNLNLGFDKNNDAQSNIFYNTGSGWINTSFHGALMIRPVLGKEIPSAVSVPETVMENENILIYPNPLYGTNLHLVVPEKIKNNAASCNIMLNDIFGRKVFSSLFSENITLPELSGGVYILTLLSDDFSTCRSTRLTIVR